jgi:hypothetical protein
MCLNRVRWNVKSVLLLQLSWQLTVNLGWEGGIYVQTCGHHLHLQCLSSYLNSLRSQQRQQNLSVERYSSVHSVCPFVTLYLLMEPSPSWGTANCAATQELPSISWNPKVQYRIHKSPPLVPILSHINPIHTIPSYLRSILILSTHVMVFPVVSFLVTFPPISYMHSSSPALVLRALPISSFLTWSFTHIIKKFHSRVCINEIKSRFDFGNASSHAVQNLSSSHLLSRTVTIKI